MPSSATLKEVAKLQADIQDLLSQNERALLSSEVLDAQRELFIKAMQHLTDADTDVLEPVKKYEALVLSGRDRRDAALKNMILEASHNPDNEGKVEEAIHCLKQYETAIISMKRTSEDRAAAARTLQQMQHRLEQSLKQGKAVSEKVFFIMEQEITRLRRFFKEHTIVLSRDEFETGVLSEAYHEMGRDIEAIVIPSRQMRLDVRQPDDLTRTYRALQAAARQVKHTYEAAKNDQEVDSVESYQALMEHVGSDYNAYLRAKADYEDEVNHRKALLNRNLDGCGVLIKDFITIAVNYNESVVTEEMYETLGVLREAASYAEGRADIEKTEKEANKLEAMLRGEIEDLSQRIITQRIIALTQKQRGYLSKMGADKGSAQFKAQLKAVEWPKHLSDLSLGEAVKVLDTMALKYKKVFSDYVDFSVEKEKEEVSSAGTADITDIESEDGSVASDPDAALRREIEACNVPEGAAAHLSDSDIDALLDDSAQKELTEKLVELSRTYPKLKTHLSAVLKAFGQCAVYNMVINPSVSWVKRWFSDDRKGGLDEDILSRLFSSRETLNAFYWLLRERLEAEGSNFETALKEEMPVFLEHLAKHPNVAEIMSSALSHETTRAYIQDHNILPFFLYISIPDELEEPELVNKRVVLSQLLTDEANGEHYQTIVSRLYGGAYHLRMRGAMAAEKLIPFFLKGSNSDEPDWVFHLENYPREKLEVLAGIMVEVEAVFRKCVNEYPGDADDAVSARRLLRATQNKVLAALVKYPDLQEAADAAKQIVNRELRMRPAIHKMLFNGLAKVFGVVGIPFGYYERWKQIAVFSKEKVKGGKPSKVLKERLEETKERARTRSVSSEEQEEAQTTNKGSTLSSQISRFLRRQ